MASIDPKALPAEPIGADAVSDYLRRHPDFLNERPDLLELLTPPERRQGDGVVDMQRFMVVKLRAKVAEQERVAERLHAVGLDNLKSQGLVQAATLALLSTRSFEHLIDSLIARLPDLLDIEASSLCVENGEPLPGRADLVGIRVLKPGAIDRIVGPATELRLAADTPGSRTLFGPQVPLIRSMALARLSFGPRTPPGLLALGSARPEGFAPGQGTELLSFFARIVELCIRRWLSLAP